jgi:hypothetical protein
MPYEPLYNIRMPPKASPSYIGIHVANLLTGKLPHLQYRIAFYHAALFSPVLSTCTHAISAGYLTTKQVTQYAPRSKATSLGHMHAQRSNMRSTKDTAIVTNTQASSQRTNNIYADCRAITGNITL